MEFLEPLLSRQAAAAVLAEAGIPCAAATLATLATRGGGPKYIKFGLRALYRRSDLLIWAASKLSSPRDSTSEPAAAA